MADHRVILASSKHLFLWQPGKDPRAEILPAEEAIFAVVAAPGGGQVVYGGTWSGPVNVYDLTAQKTVPFATDVPANVSRLALSANGMWLAAACNNGTVLLWNVVAADLAD